MLHRCVALVSLVVVLACSGSEKQSFGVPMGGGNEPSSPSDTGVESTDGRVLADVLTTVSTYPDPPTGQIMDEWVDVAVYDDFFAVQVGVSGIGLVSRQDGRVMDNQNPGRGYSVDSDGDLIVVGSRTERVSLWRFTEPSNLTPSGFIDESGVHEKVAVEGGVLAVAWRNQGVRLYSTTTDVQEIHTLSAEDAYAVDICGDWLLYSDAQELVWSNIQDPTNPQEITRIQLESEIRDIDCDGKHVALGLGGNGIQVWRIVETTLVEVGVDQPPGTVFSVSLDNNELWVATWAAVALYSIEGGELLPLGHEDPRSAAMGVAASDGSAVVADWLQSTIVERTPNTVGPEVNIPSEMIFRSGDSVSQYLWVHNHGGRTLELEFTQIPSGFSVVNTQDETQFVSVGVGEVRTIEIRVPNGNWGPVTLEWASNDPDERTGTLDIRPASNGVGSLHPDFSLPIISANGLQGTESLSDFSGKILLLSWWSDY